MRATITTHYGCGHAVAREYPSRARARSARPSANQAAQYWCPECRATRPADYAAWRRGVEARHTVSEAERTEREQVDAAEWDAAVARWRAAGTIRQQAARLSAALRRSRIAHSRHESAGGSIYLRLADGRTVRISDHPAGAFGGYAGQDILGDRRHGAPDLDVAPTRMTWREALDVLAADEETDDDDGAD